MSGAHDDRARAVVAGLLCLGLGGALAAASGCLVQSRCQTDDDCGGSERCSLEGRCVVECSADEDCWIKGVDYGKRCIDHRCAFLYDERVPAPSLCLSVVNPAAEQHGEELCLAALNGKVVQIYFGELF